MYISYKYSILESNRPIILPRFICRLQFRLRKKIYVKDDANESRIQPKVERLFRSSLEALPPSPVSSLP